jgi:hypothetical protein
VFVVAALLLDGHAVVAEYTQNGAIVSGRESFFTTTVREREPMDRGPAQPRAIGLGVRSETDRVVEQASRPRP